jgi:hypothetical protein
VKESTAARLSLLLAIAALHADTSDATAGELPVVLDVAGRRIDLGPGEAVRLRDAAAACAGNSSAARDLSLLLDRALYRPQDPRPPPSRGPDPRASSAPSRPTHARPQTHRSSGLNPLIPTASKHLLD